MTTCIIARPPRSPAALLAAAAPAAQAPRPPAPVRAALASGLPAASSAGQPLARLGEGSRWRGGTRAGGGEAPAGVPREKWLYISYTLKSDGWRLSRLQDSPKILRNLAQKRSKRCKDAGAGNCPYAITGVSLCPLCMI